MRHYRVRVPDRIRIHQIKYQSFNAVVTAHVWGYCEVMKTQNTITKKQLNKGWNAVVAETHTLNQVLKSFGGIMRKKLPELDGQTVGEFLTENGIEVKNGKVSVSAIRNAWNAGMTVDGKLAVFKNRPALWTPQEDDYLWEKNVRSFRVCSEKEAKKYVETGEYAPFVMYSLVPVDDCRWDTAVIARAMKQGRDFTKLEERALESELEWADLKEVYVVYEKEESKGVFTRKMRRISKDEVKF